MIIFGIVIRRASAIRRNLDFAVKSGHNKGAAFHHVVAIYNCRIFGLCIYRANSRWKDWPVKKHPEYPLTKGSWFEDSFSKGFSTDEYIAIRPAVEYAIMNGADFEMLKKAKAALAKIRNPIMIHES